MSRSSHSARFYHSKILGEEYKTLSSSLCSFLHSPITSFLLGPNILLNILFPNTFNLRSSLKVSDQVSHPYKSTGKIILLNELLSQIHATFEIVIDWGQQNKMFVI
jgi:hypothetical protein